MNPLTHTLRWALGVMLACLMACSTPLAAADNDPAAEALGTYQILLEGVPGTGGLSYHIAFNPDGSVYIEKKFNGRDEAETHQWQRQGDAITILPLPGGVITDFDHASLTVIDSENIDVNLNVTGASLDLLEKDTTFTLFRWHETQAKLHILLTLVILIALNELFRFVKWSGFAFFVGLSLLLTIFVWPYQGVAYWFKWAKIYSVVSASVFFLLMRFTKVHQYSLAKLFCVGFLAINIAEAVAQDFTMGFTPNLLNGVAGVLSILTCYYGWKGIRADDSPQKDMVWPKMTALWIIAYDVWNFAYVYLNFPASASAQLMVIVAATIPALFIKKGTWLQARAYTLAAWFMFYFTFTNFYERNLWIFPRNDTLTYSVAVLSLVLNIACVWQLVSFHRARQAQQKPATA
ncbi:hypothetical protein SAMN04488540_11366 [Ferrimonas sediminum]|uniref:Uncharacterized protein n=1 Tax=Ferrimonas sediminum TaxID=718193 RepID=A0A1G8WHR3_9GAMM|nr:DUF5692 family protein [Ferrimonas sediminum]SDJ77633.1 hypothetical protein SAMN04488540_11366 [Ferrimonas sediminum]